MGDFDEVTRILRDWEEINLGRILVYVAAAWLLVEVVKRLVPWITGRLPDRFRFYVLPWAPILRMLIVVVAAIEIVPMIVVTRTETLLTLFAASALAIGFAFKDYISSLIAGVVVLFERPYRIGDWVTIDDAYGEVKAINFRTIELLTPDDTVVVLPHSRVWDTGIHNANIGQRQLMCVTDFYLHPEHDGRLVRQALHDVAVTSAYACLLRPIIVVVCEKPWGTHYRIRAYPIDSRDQFQFISDLTIRGKGSLASLDIRPAAAVAAVGEGQE